MGGNRVVESFKLAGALLFGTVACFLATAQAEAFVKYTDSEVRNYLLPVEKPGYRTDSNAGSVVYLKQGDGDPVRHTPRRAGEVTVVPDEEELSPMSAEFRAAGTPEALEAFVDKYAPDELAYVAVQRLAQPMLDAKNWAGAKAIFEKYRLKFPGKTAAFSKISEVLAAPSGAVAVGNLGPGINSSVGEYAPVVSSNGKRIIFARDCGVCEGGEEIYTSSLTESGFWGEASKFGPPLISRGNEVPLALSSDGNTLAVFGNFKESLGRGDIFYVEKTRDSWGDLKHYPSPLNSEHFESNAAYSPDGSAILFVSERPGGVGEFHRKGSYFHGDYEGNTDIYVFIPDAVGGGIVKNLGPVINTPYAEYSPFLHPDGKTLYFSSNGHPGLGGLDVFKSTRIRSDSWTEWSEPVNLGKEINTSNNDWGYQFDARGERAYFAVGNRSDGFGASDIFTVGLPGQLQSAGVLSVSGKVTDPEGNFLDADLRWNDLIAGKEVGRATSNPQNGEYIIHLPVGGKYSYYAEKAGFMGQSENLDLADEFGYREFVKDIVLHPLKQAAIDQQPKVLAEIRMNNIFFDFDKSVLRSESKLELERWVRMLKDNPAVRLELEGHTDHVGTDQYNQDLSERRAGAVADCLINQGINSGRISAKGLGEKKPVASNQTAEGRQQNRRVIARIVAD